MVLSNKNRIFSSKTAIFLATMSYQTYPLYFEGKLTLPKGFTLRYIIYAFADVENPTEEVYGFIAESHNQIIISFRGYAAYPKDLLAAYDIIQIPFTFVENAGKTSRGFTCIYQSARNNIMNEINKLSPLKKLYITGHNYGGAIAVLAALDISVNSKFKNLIVYTYGSPRVGDPNFCTRFNEKVKNSVRIVNIHDSFPTFPAQKYPPPFTEEGLYYQHVKSKYIISFQYNNTPRNDGIGCYYQYLSNMSPDFAEKLCLENPGLCPDSSICFPYKGNC